MALEYLEFAYDSHFMINILIRFILLSSLIYILYKNFLVDLTIKYIISAFEKHIDFYIPDIPIINSIIPINNVILDITDRITSLISSSSDIDTTQNDNAMLIIYVSMISIVVFTVAVILVITGGYKSLNIRNITYDILINITVIILSQIVFFYLVYSYIDPIKIYNLLYFNFQLNDPITIQAKTLVNNINNMTTLTTNQQTAAIDIEKQIISLYNIPSQAANLLVLTNQLQAIANIGNKGGGGNVPIDQQVPPVAPTPAPISSSSTGFIDTMVNSKSTAIIYSFVIIFGILFIITAILTAINILVNYYNYKFPYVIIPFNGITLLAYGILAIIFLFLFIIMLILLLSRI